MKGLVDLVRFELTTSSMPWLQNQSLANTGVENTRLARRRFGPHLDRMRSSMRVWTSKGPTFEKHGCGLDLTWNPTCIAHARGRNRPSDSSCRTKKRVALYCGCSGAGRGRGGHSAPLTIVKPPATSDPTLVFNWRILQAPMIVVNYLIVHELAHVLEPNHSQDFRNLVAVHAPSCGNVNTG